MGLQVVELFAGVGGFRLGLRNAGHEVVWSNQWEPGKKAQHASDCYVRWFGQDGHSNEDVSTVDTRDIPDHDLLVGGFPCQDYSVATTLHRSGGIQGRKGVLWWQIERILRAKRPDYVLLENVDRLLRSPASQRGRDFGVLLHCMSALGYRVEWRVLNAADYGFPQRRRRVFIFAAHIDTEQGDFMADYANDAHYLTKKGFFQAGFPCLDEQVSLMADRKRDVMLPSSLRNVSDSFTFHFANAGIMTERKVWTRKVIARRVAIRSLGTVLERDVPEQYYVPKSDIPKWKYLKGAKKEERVSKQNGHRYHYAEGAIPFPDDLDQPSRTLLTGEGGTNPSRLKHLIRDPETERLRVLTPVECERLNGFRDGWTEGMPERWRYFTMGNALVVGLVSTMAEHIRPRSVDETVQSDERLPVPAQ